MGRVPIPDVQFAGVSNGESLWALPNEKSPEGTSDTNDSKSVNWIGAHSSSTMAGQDDLMADIDWVRQLQEVRNIIGKLTLVGCF